MCWPDFLPLRDTGIRLVFPWPCPPECPYTCCWCASTGPHLTHQYQGPCTSGNRCIYTHLMHTVYTGTPQNSEYSETANLLMWILSWLDRRTTLWSVTEDTIHYIQPSLSKWGTEFTLSDNPKCTLTLVQGKHSPGTTWSSYIAVSLVKLSVMIR